MKIFRKYDLFTEWAFFCFIYDVKMTRSIQVFWTIWFFRYKHSLIFLPRKKITERNTDPSLFTHCIEPKIAIVSINQNALAEYWSLSAFTILPKLLCVYHRSDDLHPLLWIMSIMKRTTYNQGSTKVKLSNIQGDFV